MPDSAVFSVRVPIDLKERIDAVAKAMDRPRSWVVHQALEQFMADQAWQVAAIEEGIEAADRGDLIPHEQVMAELRERIGKARS